MSKSGHGDLIVTRLVEEVLPEVRAYGANRD
jgi:hypothetical protein